jgi:hypothetical protein
MTVHYTKQSYKGFYIYVDTIDGVLRVRTSLHGFKEFKSVLAAKQAITKY